jgi:transposase
VAEKLAMVDETRKAGATVSLAEQGALAATQAEEEVAPASAFRAQQDMIRELQRLLGK